MEPPIDGRIDIPSESADIEALVSWIRDGTLSYPYRRYYLPPAQELFEVLKNEPVRLEKRALTAFDVQTEGMDLPATVDVYSTESLGEALTDIYTEPQRVRATVANGIYSLYQLWILMPREVLLRTISEYDRINVHSLRNSLRMMGKSVTGVGHYEGAEQHFVLAPEANNFSNSLARQIYQDYCPQGGVVLDPSGGWGDRQAGAAASGVVRHYIVIDPNEALYAGYSAMKRSIAGSMKVTVLSIGAQELPYLLDDGRSAAETVDLVFTSPPYWNLEIYSKASTQSSSIFDSYESWMEGFMYQSIERAYYRLKKGRKYMLHIRDIRGHKLVQPINEKMKSLGAVYEGLIAIVTSTTTAPVWIWSKP